MEDILAKLNADSSSLNAELCTSIIANLSSRKEAVKPKAVSKLLLLLFDPERMCLPPDFAIVLLKSSRHWLPAVLNYPKAFKQLIRSMCSSFDQEQPERAVAAGVFLVKLAKEYPKKAQFLLKSLYRRFKQVTGVIAIHSERLAMALKSVIMEIVAIDHKLIHYGCFVLLRHSFLSIAPDLLGKSKVGASSVSEKFVNNLRSFSKQLLLWTDCIIASKPSSARQLLVPFVCKLHECLEATLPLAEFSPMFLEMRRVSVDLPSKFSVFYPSIRSTVKIVQDWRNAPRADSSDNKTVNFDIRLSRSDRNSAQIIRLLKGKLQKSFTSQRPEGYRKFAHVIAPILSMEGVDAQCLRDAGMWRRMQDGLNEALSVVVKEQISPLSLIN